MFVFSQDTCETGKKNTIFTDEATETQWSYRTWLKILQISRLRSSDSQPVLLLCFPLPSCTFCRIYPVVSQRGLCSLLLISCSLAIWVSTVSGGLLEDVPTSQSAPPPRPSTWAPDVTASLAQVSPSQVRVCAVIPILKIHQSTDTAKCLTHLVLSTELFSNETVTENSVEVKRFSLETVRTFEDWLQKLMA